MAPAPASIAVSSPAPALRVAWLPGAPFTRTRPSFTWMLPATDRAPMTARQYARDYLVRWGANLADARAADAITIISELVTNGVRQSVAVGAPSIVFRITLAPRMVLVQVGDQSPVPPPAPPAVSLGDDSPIEDDLAPDGRGLAIVAALSSEFAWYPGVGWKIVWAACPMAELHGRCASPAKAARPRRSR